LGVIARRGVAAFVLTRGVVTVTVASSVMSSSSSLPSPFTWTRSLAVDPDVTAAGTTVILPGVDADATGLRVPLNASPGGEGAAASFITSWGTLDVSGEGVKTDLVKPLPPTSAATRPAVPSALLGCCFPSPAAITPIFDGGTLLVGVAAATGATVRRL
jgi:hypothetical protein